MQEEGVCSSAAGEPITGMACPPTSHTAECTACVCKVVSLFETTCRCDEQHSMTKSAKDSPHQQHVRTYETATDLMPWQQSKHANTQTQNKAAEQRAKQKTLPNLADVPASQQSCQAWQKQCVQARHTQRGSQRSPISAGSYAGRCMQRLTPAAARLATQQALRHAPAKRMPRNKQRMG